jgi:hypothetical protein
MAEIVGSLFGVSPEQLMRQRQTTDASNAFRFAQLSPMERAQYSIYQGGAGVGRAVGGLLGGDPELEKISQIKQLSSQFDLTTPDGARQFAKALQPFAPAEAMQAVREADRMEQAGLGREKTAAETTLAEARTQAALREKVPAADEESKRIRLNQLMTQLGPEEGARAFQQEQLEGKKSVAKAGATVTPGARNILEVESKRAGDLQKKIDSGYTVLERLNSQQQALEQGLIGGSFADSRTAAATFAATIGLGDQRLINALANSKSFKANQNALAAAIAKQLGVNPTDKDFQASLDQFAKQSDDPKASLQFIKQMQNQFKQRQTINENMMNSYIENDGTFRNYKGPKMIESFTATNELEQLQAEAARRRNKK